MSAAVAADPPLLASREVLARARAIVASAVAHEHITARDEKELLALLEDGATLAMARAIAADLLLWSPDLHTAHAELALELIASTPRTRSGSLANFGLDDDEAS